MNGPRTSREALFVELFGEVDALLTRVKALPVVIGEAEKQLGKTIVLLNGSGDRYRMAVTAFNEQAKADLSEYLDDKMKVTADEQRAALQLIAQDVARLAFRSAALQSVGNLKDMLDEAAELRRIIGEAANLVGRSAGSRLVEHCVTAGITAAITTALVIGLMTWLN